MKNINYVSTLDAFNYPEFETRVYEWVSLTQELLMCCSTIRNRNVSVLYGRITEFIGRTCRLLESVSLAENQLHLVLIDTHLAELQELVGMLDSFVVFHAYPVLHKLALVDLASKKKTVNRRELVAHYQQRCEGMAPAFFTEMDIWVCHKLPQLLVRKFRKMVETIYLRDDTYLMDAYGVKKDMLMQNQAVLLEKDCISDDYARMKREGNDMDKVYVAFSGHISDNLGSAQLDKLFQNYGNNPLELIRHLVGNYLHEEDFNLIIVAGIMQAHLNETHAQHCEHSLRNSLNGQEQKRRTFVKSVISELLKRKFMDKPIITTFGHWYYVYLILACQKIYNFGDYTQFIADLEWLQTEGVEIPKMPNSTYLSKESCVMPGMKLGDWKFPNPSTEPARHKMFIGQEMNQLIKPFLQLLK